MEKIREALTEILMELGFAKRHIENLEVTTEQLGISSINLLKVSMYLNKKFGTNLKLGRKENNSLQDICNQVSEEMLERKEHPVKFNIASYLLEECNLKKGRKDKTAIYFHNKSYTYGAINEKVNQMAHYLVENGVQRGDRIGIYLYSSPEFIYVFLGAVKAGIVPVLINMKMNAEDVKKIVEVTELSLLFTDERLEGNLVELKEEEQKRVVMNIGEKITQMETVFDAVQTEKEDDAFIIFTSGSSGIPKGVVHKVEAILACVNTYGKKVFQSEEEDIFYSPSPLSYALGLAVNCYLPFAAGARAVIHDDDGLYEVLDVIKAYPVTRFFAVPSVYKYLDWLISEPENPLQSLKTCMSCGEPLSKQVEETWAKRFQKKIFQCYGMTETLFLNDITEMFKCLMNY